MDVTNMRCAFSKFARVHCTAKNLAQPGEQIAKMGEVSQGVQSMEMMSYFLLAPTGALVVTMVYYIYIRGNFFRYSLSPLMQLMLKVSL